MDLKRVLMRNGTLIILFLVCLTVAGLFAGVAVYNLSLFLFIQLAGILLPGFLLLQWAGLHFKKKTSDLFVGYGIGLVIWALVYAVLLYFNLHEWSPYVLYTVSAFSVIAVLNRDIKKKLFSCLKSENVDNPFLLSIFVVIFIFGFLVFQYPHRLVADTGYLDMHMDHVYWFKNCVASTKRYPLPELSALGINLYWHLFSSFNIALFHFSTGIDIYFLCFSLSYIWHIFLMIGGAYALASELLSNRKYVFTALVLILLCSSAEPYTLVYYLDHLWGCSMGTADAIAVCMMAFVLTIKTIEDMRINWQFAPFAVIMIIGTVGYKSPVGLVLLAGVSCTLLVLCLWNRKSILHSLGLLLILFAATVILLKTFVIADGALTSSTSNHKLVLNFTTVLWPEINSQIVGFFEGLGIRPMITILFLVIPYTLMMHPIMPVFALVVVGLVVRRKDILGLSYMYQAVGLAFVVMAMIGIVAFLSLSHPGLAQCYFLFTGIPFAVLFSFLGIESFFDQRYFKYRRYLYFLIVCSFVATILCARETYTLEGKYCPDPNQRSVDGTSLTRNEWKGLVWMREHLPESAILLTNKGLASVNGSRSFVTSAYSERQVFLEGSSSTIFPNDHLVPDRIDLISRYFKGDVSARDELRHKGVTHVVVYKSLPGIAFDDSEVLYENDEITIRTL